MTTYQITDTPTALKLTSNGVIRMLEKNHIREISLVKNNTIQIDLGNNRRVFLPFASITAPQMNTAESLVEELNSYLNSFQQNCFTQFTTLLSSIAGNNGTHNPVDYSWMGNSIFFKNPKVIDEKNPNVIYKGYSQADDTQLTEPKFCIERISTMDNSTIVHEWANGDTANYNCNWNDRETYNYR